MFVVPITVAMNGGREAPVTTLAVSGMTVTVITENVAVTA
jgi:hypothetical protein